MRPASGEGRRYQTNGADWVPVATHGTVADVGDEATICSDQLVVLGGVASTTELVLSPAASVPEVSFSGPRVIGLPPVMPGLAFAENWT